jgi:hypothetical protein
MNVDEVVLLLLRLYIGDCALGMYIDEYHN